MGHFLKALYFAHYTILVSKGVIPATRTTGVLSHSYRAAFSEHYRAIKRQRNAFSMSWTGLLLLGWVTQKNLLILISTFHLISCLWPDMPMTGPMLKMKTLLSLVCVYFHVSFIKQGNGPLLPS